MSGVRKSGRQSVLSGMNETMRGREGEGEVGVREQGLRKERRRMCGKTAQVRQGEREWGGGVLKREKEQEVS